MKYIDKSYIEKRRILRKFYKNNKKANKTIKYLNNIHNTNINIDHISDNKFIFFERLLVDGYVAYHNDKWIDYSRLLRTYANNKWFWLYQNDIISDSEIYVYMLNGNHNISILEEIMLNSELNMEYLISRINFLDVDNIFILDKNIDRLKKLERII